MQHFTPENFQTCTIGMLLGRAALVKDRILDSHLQDVGVTAAQSGKTDTILDCIGARLDQRPAPFDLGLRPACAWGFGRCDVVLCHLRSIF